MAFTASTPASPRRFEPAAESDRDVGLREVLGLLRRQRWLILGTVVTLSMLAVIVLSLMTPRFRAQTSLMIGSRSANFVNLDSVVSDLPGDPETIQSEIEVLRSRHLAEQVVRQLDLEKNPEFNSALRTLGPLEKLLSTIYPRPSSAMAGTDQTDNMPRVVDAFLGALEVAPRGQSRVIGVAVLSRDPKIAAEAANTLAELYIVDQLESKYDATRRATAWLNERVESLRDQVVASERAIEDFRRQSGLLENQGTTLTAQELSDLNSQYLQARAVRAAAETRLRQIESLVDTPDGLESIGEVLDSSLIQRLREQETAVRRELAELSSEYGELHPRMIQLRAEAADVEARIGAEVNKIIIGLRNELEIARASEASLARGVDELKSQVAEVNSAQVGLRALEREAEANRLLLETMLSRFMETSSQQDMAVQRADARIISRADIPITPAYPMKRAVLALTAFAAAFLGVLLAFAREATDKGFRGGEQIEQATGAQSLGMVPLIKRRKHRKNLPAYVIDHPQSAFAQAVRNLDTRLTLARHQAKPKKILFTSSQPREGKTTTAVVFARLMAMAGNAVVLVDADCRRSSVHGTLGMDRGPGLSSVLDGQIPLNDALRKDESTGLLVLTAGSPMMDPLSHLGSSRMKSLLSHLATTFHYVILDCPPVMAASDAVVLSLIADITVVIVRWGKTRRQSVRMTIDQLQRSGGEVAGVLLTQVDVDKYSLYGYGDSGSYAGPLGRYYAG